MSMSSAQRTLVVGVTGSIGMGKTSVSRQFAKLGFPVQDADAEVHKLYACGGAAVAPVAAFGERFGTAVLSDAGGICRQKLSSLLAEDPSRFAELNAIVHPLLAQGRSQFLAAANKAESFCAVLDVPMLFESTRSSAATPGPGAAEASPSNIAGYDYVVVATTLGDVAIQAERVLQRDGWTQEKLDMILAKQTPDADKRARADIVIDTRDTNLSAMKSQVATAVEKMVAEHPALFHATLAKGAAAAAAGAGAGAGADASGISTASAATTDTVPIKVVALDLDDTIWPLMGWINQISPIGDDILQVHMPRAYDAGLRYPLRTAMEEVKQAHPFLSHDIGARRSKALGAIAVESGDPPSAVDTVMEEIEKQRTALAVGAMYDDVIPFLTALRRQGIIIAAITDGTADVMNDPTLSELFKLSVSASSSGAEKPGLAPFLELLTAVSQVTGRKIHPNEVLVVGDNYGKDCVGALRAGMVGAWLRRPEGEQVPLPTTAESVGSTMGSASRPDPRVLRLSSLTEDALAAAGVVLAAPAAGL